jgi:hypothetical protein
VVGLALFSTRAKWRARWSAGISALYWTDWLAGFLFLGNCLDRNGAEVCVAIKEDKDGGQ